MEKRAAQVIRREREMLRQEEEASYEGGQTGEAEQAPGIGQCLPPHPESTVITGSLTRCSLPTLSPLGFSAHDTASLVSLGPVSSNPESHVQLLPASLQW